VYIGDLLFLAAAVAIVAAIVLGYMGGRRLWRQHVADLRAAKRDDAALTRAAVPSNDLERSEPAIEVKKDARIARH
jgi:hypothetical protein